MIRPDREEKLVTASHLEEQMNIESLRSSVNFSSQLGSGPVTPKARQTLLRV